MKSIKSIVFVLSVTVFALAGCQSSEPPQSQPKEITGPSDRGESPFSVEDRTAESDLMLDEMEASLSPDNIDAALSKINSALASQPENKRGQFWRMLLLTVSEFKGIVTRIKPLYLDQPNGANRYVRFSARVAEGRTSNWKSFFLQGPEDIDSMDTTQEWLDRVLMRLAEFHEWVAANRSQQLRVHLSSAFVPRNSDAAAESPPCASVRIGILPLPTEACLENFPTDVSLNQADFEMLGLYLASLQAQLRILNAYRIQSQLVFDSAYARESETPRKFIEVLLDFLQKKSIPLRDPNHMSSMFDVLRDFNLSLRYLNENRSQLCPPDQISPEARKHHLFPFALCYGEPGSNIADRTLEIFDAILSGDTVTVGGDHPQRSLEINFGQFFDFPLSDLSKVGPIRLNECQRVVKMNSSVLSRFVESGNINTAIKDQPCPTPTPASTPGPNPIPSPVPGVDPLPGASPVLTPSTSRPSSHDVLATPQPHENGE